ncbi:MAG: radical SAM protein [Nanoarchaeota archaeon]|nr:radical SAM protein [Nanoarchaeota archaeon]
MKITLISTSTFPSDQGIRTISSVLKEQGHSVKIVFMTLTEDYSQNYSKKELIQLAKICRGSKLIGINSFASTAKRAAKIIPFLEKTLPKIPIVYGGVHATISPEKAIKDCNLVVVGEAEITIKELAKAIEESKSIKKIKNLWIKEDGKLTKNPLNHLIDDLDQLPFIDYDLEDHYILENSKIRKFQEKDLTGQVFFLTGRGCPYGCDYCSNSHFNKMYEGKRKKILRWHSPKYMVDCILFLKSKFPSLTYLDIRDDTFSLRPLNHIKEFCEIYKEKVNMRFKCLADPKTVTDEKIKLLVDAGCTDIIIGIQGSERANKEIYHRMQTDENVIRTAKILNKYKQLAVMYDVITCNPYEKPSDIVSLIRLLQKLPKPYYLSVNNLVFFPGTQLYQKAKIDGTIKTEEDAAYQLNYWDRGKHIKLKKKNIYLNLILNLMRGSVTQTRFGFMPNSILNFLLNKEIIEKNLKNPTLSYVVLFFLSIYDFNREKILKPVYRSLPVSFKTWYDTVRYRV